MSGRSMSFVELDELARLQRLGERVGEADEHRDAPTRLAAVALAVEVERALDLIGRRQLEREVAQREVFELVFPFARDRADTP